MVGYHASKEVTKKALDNGESAADAAVKARQAAEEQVMIQTLLSKCCRCGDRRSDRKICCQGRQYC